MSDNTFLKQQGPGNSPLGHAAIDAEEGGNPIALYTGEKRERVTDIAVATPAGALAFTRSYRQSKLADANYKFMGLGWLHNHSVQLTQTPGTPNTIIVRSQSGGEVSFTETFAGSNNYAGDPGSTAAIVWDGTKYTLTMLDRTQYVFDVPGQLSTNQWQLTSIIYTSGETWSYSYDGTTKKLLSVTDTYGKSLQFSYISDPGQYDDGQLWRVGDQTASGLSTSTPTGRYVEFSYVRERLNGAFTANANPLLSTVKDVRGNLWTYIWYGQAVGETDSNQLDFLVELRSPLVDLLGSGFATSAISRQKNRYTMNGATIAGINQRRGNGLLTTDWAFQPGGQNITTEITAGKITTHRFAGNLYLGKQDPAGNFSSTQVDGSFRPAIQTDANGNLTNLTWTPDGKHLNSVQDALGHQTLFAYVTDASLNGGNSLDALLYRIDTQGRKTLYTYGDAVNPRLPTRVQVYDTDGHTILAWQEFVYDSAGRTLTEKTFDPTSSGMVLQQEVDRSYYTSGNGNGLLQKVTLQDLLNPSNSVTTIYFYDTAGRVIRTNQSLTFGTCTSSFQLYDAAGNVIASVCDYDPGQNLDPTTVAQTVALFNPLTPDKNKVTTFEYDGLGRLVKTTVNAGAAYARSRITVYDAMNRVIRTIDNYVPFRSTPTPYTAARTAFNPGPNNDQNLVTDTVHNERGLVQRQVDVLGNVTLFGYDDAGRLVKTIQSASRPTYNNAYSFRGDPSLAKYVASDAPDLDIVTANVYDAAGNLVQSTDALGNVSFIVYDALNRPVKMVRNAKDEATLIPPGTAGYTPANDPRSSGYVASSAADRDLIEQVEYDAMGRVRRSQDVMGTWILYGYDAQGRQVRVIRSASQPSYNLDADPSLSIYPLSSNPDQDLVSRTTYDAQQRVLYTADVLAATPSVTERRTWSAYDGLGRVVKTILNAVGSATDNGPSDPRSSLYSPNTTTSDQDLISLTAYDSNGRVARTQDSRGNYTLYGYDAVNRQVRVVQNTSNFNYNAAADPSLSQYTFAPQSGPDQDIITQTVYDAQGRVAATIDPLGNQTQYTYDALGRRIQTITNLVTGRFNANRPDQDLVETVSYDLAGRIVSTVDARSTQTTLTYDRLGRRLSVTQAAGTSLKTTSYTCYDKLGRVLRVIQNWINATGQISPDARDAKGVWLFNPSTHGTNNDQNLISTYILDRAGRALAMSDPLGNLTTTAYYKNGQVESVSDALNVVSKYRYDRARRRVLVVQSYTAGTFTDPASWAWNAGAAQWQDGNGTPITFGSLKDQNIILSIAYDKAGRMTSVRDPRGNLTSYTYDKLDRRTGRTDPRTQTWATAYAILPSGTSRVTQTDPIGNVIQSDTDRLGRLAVLSYPGETPPKATPDVTFSYDKGGNRTGMSESNGLATVRGSAYSYDKAYRLLQANYDTNGDGSTDQSVSYQYDAGGLRTKMTLPGSLNVTYQYDAKGRLTSLTDWSSQATQYTYDNVDRLHTLQRSNALNSTYTFDAASRLTNLSHVNGANTIASFAYSLNALGNRTGVVETQALNPSGSDTHNMTYAYDALQRVTQTIHRAGGTLGSGTVQRQYDYQYDVAGNRTQQIVTISGTPTTTPYSYDNANRLSSDGTHTFTYDNAGRLTNDGVNGYTWDRANRLLSFNGSSYGYDGDGNRVQQTVGANVTGYLLDTEAGLAQVIQATTGANTLRYLHGPTGLQQQQNADSTWRWTVQDGLGTIREVVNATPAVQESRLYSPYGELYSSTGTSQTVFGFTGEPTDTNNLLYLRARYMQPTTGMFLSLDPVEGVMSHPMSYNGYAYVEGNPTNWTDHSGKFIWLLALVAAEAAAGAIIGGDLAGGYAMTVYDQAIQCHCGQPMYDWAASNNRQQVIQQATYEGMAWGAAAGAFAAVTGPLGLIGLGAAGIIGGLSQATGALQNIIRDITHGTISTCDVADFGFGAAEAAAGAASVDAGIGGLQGADEGPLRRWTRDQFGDKPSPGGGGGGGGGPIRMDSGNPLYPDGSIGLRQVNNAGTPYPQYTDARTNRPIPFPAGVPSQTIDPAMRVNWQEPERGIFKAQWQSNFATPPEGWDKYWSERQIHHIKPRAFGGTNDYWNLVPVETPFHQKQFTPWWNNWGK